MEGGGDQRHLLLELYTTYIEMLFPCSNFIGEGRTLVSLPFYQVPVH